MKIKSGFTLIELLGVIIIIGILSVVALPQIINQMNKSKGNISSATIEVFYHAGEIYLDKNQSTYHQNAGNTFCVSLKELTDAGELEAPLIDAKSGQEISLTKVLKFTVEDRTGVEMLKYDLKLYEPSECKQVNE